jgi:plasmid stabilization system protein ParE
VPEFRREDLREIGHQNYRIAYFIRADVVSVVAVIHARMDVAARLRDIGEAQP